MFWRLGWILNTLSYQVEKNLRETVYASESFLAHRWNPIEKQILKISKSPLKYALLIPVSAFMLFTAALMLKQYYYPAIKPILYELRWVFNWQDVIMGAQLTLIGLVFPLVIGLVGFLLQSKTASKAIWAVYNHYSAFLFSGFSGLMLIAFIVIGRYIESLDGDYPYIAHCIFSSAWFLANMFFSGWFLLATFKIIQEYERDKLVVRYTINESFIQSIRKRLTQLLPQSAFHHGILHVKDDADFKASTMRYGLSLDYPVKRSFGSEKYVKAIRFRLLQWVLRIKASRFDDSGDTVFPLSVDDSARKEFILADFSAARGSLMSRLLIRMAYSFSVKPPFDLDHLDDIVFAIVGNVHDEFANDVRRFELAVKKLIVWHCDIADSLSFENDNKEPDNWLQLVSSSFFGRSYLEELLYEYHQIVKKSVAKIPVAPEYFSHVMHLYPRLNNFSKHQLPILYIEKLLQSQYLCWYALVNWYRDVQGEKLASVTENYRTVLIDYVGTWESWLTYLEPKSSRWNQPYYTLKLFTSHLKYTAQSIISSVNCKDEISAKWAVDMMLYWFSNASTRDHGTNRYLWKTPILVHNLLETSHDTDEWKYILNSNSFDEKTASEVAVEHAWRDIRTTTSAYIAALGLDDDLRKKLVDALISGRRFNSEIDSEGISQALNHPAKIFQSYLRQIWFSGYEEQSYGAWLSGVVDAFNGIDEPKRISGRVYFVSGARDVRSLRVSFVYLVARISTKKWNISQAWMDLLFSDVSTVQRREEIQREIEHWIKHLAGDDSNLATLSEELKDNCIASLNELSELLIGQNQQIVAQAPIDNDRLLEFATNASRDAFQKDTGVFLVTLFDEIKVTDQENAKEEHTLKINEYDKANVALDVDVNRSVNEADWMSENIKRSVVSRLTAQVVLKKAHIDSKFTDAREVVKRVVSDIGMLPEGKWVILVGCWPIERLLDEQLYEVNGKEFDVKYLNNFGDSYVLHLSNIPVYRINRTSPGSLILIEKSAFKALEVRQYSNGKFVDVTFSDLNDDTLKGVLKFKYQVKAEFGDDIPSYRYQLVEAEGSDDD